MLLSVRHTTHYRYDRSGSFAVQRLRLTPGDTRAQKVLSWTIACHGLDQAAQYVDGFCNRVHLVTHCKPYDELTITAEGEVKTTDTGGVVGDLAEAANPRLFMRGTPLTEPSPGIEAMVDELAGENALSKLHELMDAIARRVAYVEDATDAGTSAAAAFEAGQGVCQDHAHIFIAAARRLDVPARYVTGYLHLQSERDAVAHHAWAEAWVPNLGWVGFDPANNICPTERYVRLACGFDAPGAAPIAGTRRGGGNEALTVDVLVKQRQQQQQ